MLNRWSDFDRTFAMMDELRRRMDRLFPEFESDRYGYDRSVPAVASAWPRLNLHDSGTALVLRAEVPGLTEKDVNLTINQDVLTLSGERKSDAPEGYSVHRQERAPIKFARSFTLPCKVDAEQVNASLKNGVLTVTLPKAAEAKPKQIAVSAS